MSSNPPAQGAGAPPPPNAAAANAAPPPPPPPTTVNCTIDGKPYTFPRGTLIVDAVHKVGRPIPYYCYHPKLAPVGACRVCMVSVLGAPLTRPGMGPIVTTGCTTPVFEGLQIETMSEPAKLARKQVLEFLLINHPLDCPICDKGGECDLQDFTLRYGPGVSDFAEAKIQRKKADDLGPFLVLDQERCILCQRCVRYENEVLGEQNLVLKERGDRTVIETGRGEPYGGYFSGNNTELCPVGALTSRTYRFKARPWDVRPVRTVCQGCSVGCNVTVNLRNDKIVRLLLRDNMAVDGGWLCDRGRYGYGHTNAEARLTVPLVKRDGRLVSASWDDAIAAVAAGFAKGVGVLGGGRLTDEEALLLSELTRVALKTNDVDWRIGYQGAASPEAIGARPAAIADIDAADLVVLVDTSLLEEAPVVEIRLRKAAGKKTKVVDLGPVKNFRLGRSTRVVCAPEEIPSKLGELAEQVKAAQKPIVVWNGRGGEAMAEAVAALGAPVLVPGEFNNGRGAEAAGLVPDLLPGYRRVGDAAAVEAEWGAQVPRQAGRDARGILEAAAAGQIGALYLVGANPLRTYPDGELVTRAMDAVPFVVVQDMFLTETAQQADVVLPVLGPMEKKGTVTNFAGVRQAVERAVAGPAGPKADGSIFALLAAALGAQLSGKSLPEASERARPALPPTGQAPAQGDGLRVLHRPRLYAGGGTTAFDPNFSSVREEGEVRLHPQDAEGLADGQTVHVKSGTTVLRAVARLDRSVGRGYLVLASHAYGARSLGSHATLEPAPEPAVAVSGR